MAFALRFSPEAARVLQQLEGGGRATEVKLRKVRKAMALLSANPRHAGLRSHVFASLKGPNGETVWESYVENQTSSAWRLWWWYGPERDQISVLTIGPHPD